MRIPLHQTYRAFRELDGFSDEQCEQWVNRVRAQDGAPHFAAASLTALLTLPVTAVIGGWSLSLLAMRVADEDVVFAAGIVLFAVFPAGATCLSWLLVRDRLLIRAIRNRVLLVRCPRCRYSLLGLRHEDGFVLCPECGTRHELAAIGLSPADLIGPRGEA